MSQIVSDLQLQDTHFDNARLARVGAEVMTLNELRSRVATRRFLAPERVDFFMLLLVQRGAGAHMVDFIDMPLAPGSLVFVRPGQVQQWRNAPHLEGIILLAAPHALRLAGVNNSREAQFLSLDDWPAVLDLDDELRGQVTAAMDRLRKDLDAFDGEALTVALIHFELLALLLRVARRLSGLSGSPDAGAQEGSIYRIFKASLEQKFTQRWTAKHYAQHLGCSESTLARSCRDAEGKSPKHIIDRRVALEAQRLLVHSGESVAAIGYRLGFSEPTNFVKFFARMTSMTPQEFRRRMEGAYS